jgi:hypothetical protein
LYFYVISFVVMGEDTKVFYSHAYMNHFHW